MLGCQFVLLLIWFISSPYLFNLAHKQHANRRKSGTDIYPVSFSFWGKPTGCSSYPQDTIKTSSMILEIIQSFEKKKKNHMQCPHCTLGMAKVHRRSINQALGCFTCCACFPFHFMWNHDPNPEYIKGYQVHTLATSRLSLNWRSRDLHFHLHFLQSFYIMRRVLLSGCFSVTS